MSGKKRRSGRQKSEEGLCEMCWEKPKAEPFIYIDVKEGGSHLTRFVCYDCAKSSILNALSD